MKYYKNDTFKMSLIEKSKKKLNTLKWVLGAMERDIALLSPTQFVTRKSPEYNSLLNRRTVLDWDIQKERQFLKDVFRPLDDSIPQETEIVSFVAKTKVA